MHVYCLDVCLHCLEVCCLHCLEVCCLHCQICLSITCTPVSNTNLEKFEDIKWVIRRTDNTMTQRKRTKEQTMIFKTLHRKLNIVKHEQH